MVLIIEKKRSISMEKGTKVYEILKNGRLPLCVRLSLFKDKLLNKLFRRKPIELTYEVGSFKGVHLITTPLPEDVEEGAQE
jgi:hypothetical protein